MKFPKENQKPETTTNVRPEWLASKGSFKGKEDKKVFCFIVWGWDEMPDFHTQKRSRAAGLNHWGKRGRSQGIVIKVTRTQKLWGGEQSTGEGIGGERGKETGFVCIQKKVTPTDINQKGHLLQGHRHISWNLWGQPWNLELESCPEPAVALFFSVPPRGQQHPPLCLSPHTALFFAFLSMQIVTPTATRITYPLFKRSTETN